MVENGYERSCRCFTQQVSDIRNPYQSYYFLVGLQSIIKGYKTELHPNHIQKQLFKKAASIARFTYNWALSYRIEEYRATGKSSNFFELQRKFYQLKRTEFTWMYEVSKCVPQYALRNLEKAYKRFYSGLAKYPKYKKKKNELGSFTLSNSVHINSRKIQLPRIGLVRLKEKDYLPKNQHIISATISERAGRWFISVIVRESYRIKVNQGPIVGIDLGINQLVTCSDGKIYSNPKSLKQKLNKLKKLQKEYMRKKNGSMNQEKIRNKIAKIHYNIVNIRNDAIHKITTNLAKTKSVIVMEDLNIKGMLKNHTLAQSLVDASFGEIRRQLQYKCKWYSSILLLADQWFPSTKRCSNCGKIREISLSERVYKCGFCGLEIDRDLNAARNLEFAVSSTEILNAWRELPDTIYGDSVNQESNVEVLQSKNGKV